MRRFGYAHDLVGSGVRFMLPHAIPARRHTAAARVAAAAATAGRRRRCRPPRQSPMRVHISLTALSADAVHAGITLSAARDVTEEPCEPWRVGAYVVSEREPRLIIYPNFLAPDEADYLSELARWGALEAAAAASMSGILVQSAQAVSWDGSRPARVAASGRTASIHLPRPCDDPAIQAIEERCAAATVATH